MTIHITKTWFDGEKVVTQEIPESEIYKPAHMTDRELMQQALDALEKTKPKISQGSLDVLTHDAAITALRNRLAQPEQELVIDCPRCGHCCPQRPWVGLTDEEIDEMERDEAFIGNVKEITRAIEAKLKEKTHDVRI